MIIISTNGSFSGFIVQARSVPDGNLTGEFTVSDPNLQQTLNCDPAGVASKVRMSVGVSRYEHSVNRKLNPFLNCYYFVVVVTTE